MTEAATHFVTATTFQALSGKPVYIDQWDARMPNAMAHIDLSRQADLILVAPASADFLARIAHGMADDLLATMVLARDCPLLVAPAMNRQMWESPATQRNITQLQVDGYTCSAPRAGSKPVAKLVPAACWSLRIFLRQSRRSLPPRYWPARRC
jgi:phosphopantothenoylcysteine decarboxylase/phosphopantothenate--cysteine ligase